MLGYTRLSASLGPVRGLDLSPLYKSSQEQEIPAIRARDAADYATGLFQTAMQMIARQSDGVRDQGNDVMQRIVWAYQSARDRVYSDFTHADEDAGSAYAMTRENLRTAALSTDSGIVRRYAEARLLLSGAAASARNLVKKNGDTADTQIKNILDRLSKSFLDILNAGSGDCKTASTTATRNLNRWIRAIPENFAIAGEPQLRVENEAKSVNAEKLGKQALDQISTRSTQVEAYFTTNKTRVTTVISNRVSPTLQNYANGIKELGTKSVDKAFNTAFHGLKKQANAARTANANMHRQAQAGLAEQRKGERARLEQESVRVSEALYQEADRAIGITHGTLRDSLPLYTDNAGRMADTLDQAAASGPASLRRVAEQTTKTIQETTAAASQLQQQQVQTIRSGTEQGLNQYSQIAHEQQCSAVDALRESLRGSADAWSLSMAESATSMTGSFATVARGVQNEAKNWGTPFEQKFAKFIEDQRKELESDLPEFERKVGVNKDKYLNWVNPQARPDLFFAAPLTQAAIQAWSRVTSARLKLGRALDAGIIDTVNEEGVSDALRGLTAVQGNALRSVWRGTPDLAKLPVFKAVTKTDVYSLDSHLKFALGPDSNDYYSAINYLNGNTAEGARYELKASMHWYNDEEARIEKVMRSLTEEQRQQLHQLDGWADTAKDVRDALGGTDLDVFNALDDGNHALADAYRMRESLIDARGNYDKDAVNAVLAQYSEGTSYGGVDISGADRRAQVQREFARIQGVDLDARTQQILRERAAQAPGAPAATTGSVQTAPPTSAAAPAPTSPPTTALSATGGPATPATAGQEAVSTEPPKPSDILTELAFSVPTKSPEEQARDEAAGMVLFEYATRDMVRQTGSHREGDYRTETISFQGAERDLARDLIFHGDRSPEARASRLGVEVQRGRRPDMVNLDTALVDPRLNPNLRHDMSAEALQQLRTQALREREEMFRIFARRYGKASDDVTVIQSQRILVQQLKDVYGEDKVGASIAALLVWEEHPSPVTAALEMHYAIDGAGTNNKLIDRVLPRMNRDEIARMRGHYKTITGNDLYEDLGVYGHGWFGDLSGDDRLRAERQLRGRPRNDREKFEAAAYAMQQQRDETGVIGSWLASGSMQDLQLGYMQEEMGALIGGDVRFGPDGEAVWTGAGDFDQEGKFTGDASQFTALTESAQIAAENYSAKIDQYANFAATTIAVIGAIAAAVATVVTGGAASPLLMAAIAGITGLTAMGAQYMIKGGRYGWEQAATDLGMTAVQALTAGIGQKLALASRGLGSASAARQLAMRQAQGLAPQIGKSGIIIGQMGHLTGNAFMDKLLIGIGTGAIGSLSQTAIDEQTWDKGAESGILNLFAGMFRGALVGGVTAGVTNAIEDLPLKRIPGLGGLSKALGKDTIGEAIGESTNVAGRAFGKAATSSVGAFVGRGVELEFEAARGRYRGDAGDIFVAMAEAGGMSALQSFGEGAFEARAQLIHNARVQKMRQQAMQEAETFRRAPEPGPESLTRPSVPETENLPPETGAQATKPTELEPSTAVPLRPAEAVEPETPVVTTRRPAAVEPIGHAAAVAGSGFRGDLEMAPRAGMVGRSMRAVEALATEGGPLAGIARIPEGETNRVAVRVADGAEVKARLSVIDQMPSDADGTVPVARYHFDESAGEYVVQVSARASPDVVERAVAHELAEISHAHGAGEIDVALRPGGLGSRPLAEGETPRLAPHDRGRLAELEVLARQIDGAMQSGDELKAARLHDEAQRLATHMGLSGDSEAAAVRRAVVDTELASRPAARVLLDTAIIGAQDNPFLQRRGGDLAEDLDLLASQLAHARILEDAGLTAQVLELARRRLISAGLVKPGRSRKVAVDIDRLALNHLVAQGDEARVALLHAAEALARSNPNLETTAGIKDPAVLDPHQSEVIRQQFGDRTQFQDWPEFQKKFFASRSSYDAQNPEHLAIAFSRWTSGDYVGPEGALRSVTAATRRPDPGFERRWAQVPAEFPGATPEAKTKLPAGVTVADAVDTRRILIDERAALAHEMMQPDTLPARYAEIDARVRKLSGQINAMSEALGEAAGRKYASEQPGGMKEIPLPRSGANLPDLVFESDSGRLLVIEAKGGESELGIRRSADRTRMVEQGTREYLDSLARTMMSSPDEEISKLGHRILTELNKSPPNIDYVVVRQPFTDDNRLATPSVGTFDITGNVPGAGPGEPTSTRILAVTPEPAAATKQPVSTEQQKPEPTPSQRQSVEEKIADLRRMLGQNDIENFRSLLGELSEDMGVNREQLINKLFMPAQLDKNRDAETGLTVAQKHELEVERFKARQLKNKEMGRKVAEARIANHRAEETERLLSTIAAELHMDREQLIHRIFDDMVDWMISDQTSSEKSGLKGRRPNTRELTDILRGRMRAAGLDFEGFVLDSILTANIEAIRSIRRRIDDVSPDAILTVERGGVFLADAITQSDQGLERITHRLPKGPKGERTPHVETRIRQLIAAGKKNFVLVDFYMGGGASREFMNMYRNILLDHPEVRFESIWMREQHGFERNTENGLGLEAFKGTPEDLEHAVTQTAVTTRFVLGDDMNVIFDPDSQKPIIIFDRKGDVIQQIPPGTPDPRTGKPTKNTREILLLLLDGVQFPG